MDTGFSLVFGRNQLKNREIEASFIWFLFNSHFGAKEVAETAAGGLPLGLASAG